MTDNNDKRKVWIYASILFISAFIVLLLTALSQIKLNKNVDNYKSQINSQIKEKSDFQLNLNSSINENKKLKEEISELKKDIQEEKKLKEETDKKIESIENKFDKTVEAYEKLISAEKMYSKGDFISCAVILNKECDSRLLDKEAYDHYLSLMKTSYAKAGKELYIEGFSLYKSKKFDEAVSKFQLSVSLTPNEYYSDDSYFFMAYSYFNIDKLKECEETINTLISSFPDSSYIDDANYLLKRVLEAKGD